MLSHKLTLVALAVAESLAHGHAEHADEPERIGLCEFRNQPRVQPNLSPGYPCRLLPALRPKGHHYAMSARHHSFTLSRSGLKAGYYVPTRLRIVYTLTVLSGVPMVIAVIAFAMASLRFADQIGLGVIWRNPIAFYMYCGAVLLATGWTVSLTATAILRVFFRITGMMTRAEAQHYPLRADKNYIDPWPEAWQKPDVRGTTECSTEQQDEGERG